jgi:hypothetical protein
MKLSAASTMTAINGAATNTAGVLRSLPGRAKRTGFGYKVFRFERERFAGRADNSRAAS